jgi:hypothetical protein
MATVQAFCDRALLIHDGEQHFLGEPEEAAMRYYRLNFGGAAGANGPTAVDVPDVNVRLENVWLADEAGQRVDNVEQGRTFRLHLLARARQELVGPVFNFHCLNREGHWVFAFSKELDGDGSGPARVADGERVRIVAEITNPLLPGRYSLECWISRSDRQGGIAIHMLRLLDFHVYGTRPAAGNVVADAEVEALLDPAERA